MEFCQLWFCFSSFSKLKVQQIPSCLVMNRKAALKRMKLLIRFTYLVVKLFLFIKTSEYVVGKICSQVKPVFQLGQICSLY